MHVKYKDIMGIHKQLEVYIILNATKNYCLKLFSLEIEFCKLRTGNKKIF